MVELPVAVGAEVHKVATGIDFAQWSFAGEVTDRTDMTGLDMLCVITPAHGRSAIHNRPGVTGYFGAGAFPDGFRPKSHEDGSGLAAGVAENPPRGGDRIVASFAEPGLLGLLRGEPEPVVMLGSAGMRAISTPLYFRRLCARSEGDGLPAVLADCRGGHVAFNGLTAIDFTHCFSTDAMVVTHESMVA